MTSYPSEKINTMAVHDEEKYVASENDNSTKQPAVARIDPAIEKSMRRKMDKRVPWLIAFLFLLSFLDRSNIGNAKIAGMSKALKLTSDDYTWLLTIFYITYIVFQVQAFMWRIVKPHQWCAFIVFAWGAVATAQAGTKSWGGMMVCRFLLGAFEAGFGPSVPYLLSFFYLRNEIGSRCGLFLSAAPLANTFAGALAYGITSGHSKKIANWRLLFLVEGLPTILAALAAWFILPDSPTSAKFLTPEEQEVARLRTLKQKGSSDANEAKNTLKFREIFHTLKDAKAWLTAFMYFSCNVSYASLPVFLPTILNEMGFTAINAQGLSAPPYFVSFLVTIATTLIADRIQQRGLMVAGLSVLGGIGYVLLATTKQVAPRYAGVFLAASGVFPAIANILPWVVNNQGSDTRRGMGIVLLNVVGQCGPILGTRIFPAQQGPRYIEGQSICAAFMFFNAILALTLRTLLVWENKQLDKKFGSIVEQKRLEAEGVVEVDREEDDRGSENYGPKFRYVV